MNKKRIFKNLSLVILLFAIVTIGILVANLYSSEATEGKEFNLSDLVATPPTGSPIKTNANKSNYDKVMGKTPNDLLKAKVTDNFVNYVTPSGVKASGIPQLAEYAFCVQHTNANSNVTRYITQILDIGGTSKPPKINDLNKAKYYTTSNPQGKEYSGDIYSKLAIYAYMQNVYKVENYRGYRNGDTGSNYENSLNYLLPQSAMTGVESASGKNNIAISQGLIELENNYAAFVNNIQKTNGKLFDEGQTKEVNSSSNATYGPINIKLKNGLAAKYTEVHYTYEDEYNKTHENKVGAIGTFRTGVEIKLKVVYTDETSEEITKTSSAYIKNKDGKKINLSTFDWKSNFYVVPATGKVIKEVEVHWAYDTYKARFMYLSGSYNGTGYARQGYGLFGGQKYTIEDSYTITVNSSVDVYLKKVDSSSKEPITKRPVVFNIYSGNTLIGTVSTTAGGNGISNKIALTAGTYKVKEISNGNYGYRRANYEGTITITKEQVAAKKDITIELDNTKELKDLTIQKVGEKDLAQVGVSFIVSINDGNTTKYIRLINSEGAKVDNISTATVSTTGYSTDESNYSIQYVENASDATIFITGDNGLINIKNLEVWANSSTKYTYTAIEQSNDNYGYKGNTNAGMSAKTTDLAKTHKITVKNIQELGNLKIEKVDQTYTDVALAGVDFNLSNELGYISLVGTDGKAVEVITGTVNISKIDKAYTENGTTYYKLEYAQNEKDATILKTNEKGILVINNLEVYKNKSNEKYSYTIKEIATNNDYYQITDATVNVTLVKDDTVEKEITNKQAYIDLSGYVWEDMPLNVKGDESYNNLYQDNEADKQDIRVSGVTVRLIDSRTGNVVTNANGEKCETVTDSNGEYKFTKVSIDELSNYYVEFTYDGYTYTSVAVNLDKDNGSKAQEVAEDRTNLNNKYKGITNGFTNPDINVKAVTNNIKQSTTEITNINLGIVKREQTDIAINNNTDIDNVKVSVNGYTHTYTYNQNIPTDGIYNSNISVTEQSKHTGEYVRKIPETDIEFSKTLAENDDRRLKVYITYKIVLQNDTQNLAISTDELVNYLDPRYTVVASWLEDGTKINWSESSKIGTKYTGNEYKAIYTNDLSNKKLNYIGTQDSALVVYLQVLVDDNTTLGLLNGDATLNNITEVNSYTTYYTDKTYEAGTVGNRVGEVYASLDKDSIPGNAVPGEKSTYEDDTKAAPSMKLTVEQARGLAGIVWEDQNVKTNEERVGNGILDTAESKVANVKVELLNADTLKIATLYGKDGSTSQAVTYTNSEGIYQFLGVIPGNYITRFTYGTIDDEHITTINEKNVNVKDYKSTIMASDEINSAVSNGSLDWYLLDKDTRYSDATDNLEERAAIETSRYGNIDETNKISAETPKFNVAIEFTSLDSTPVDAFGNSTEGDFVQIYDKMDLGIIERPIVNIEVKKEISYVKVTLQSGDKLIEGDPRSQNIAYVKTGLEDLVPMEIDTELLQGARLDLTYAITVTNNSEIDYDYTQDGGYYYKYGKTINDSKLIDTTITKLVDYLDNTVVLDETSNTDWTKVVESNLCTVNENKEYVANKNNYISSDVYDKLKDGRYIILETSHFSNLTRGNSDTVELKVSKLLAETDDITINNYTEILELGGQISRTVKDSIPGNYVPGTEKKEKDEDSIKLTIAPPTGGETVTTTDYTSIIISSVFGLTILAIGIFIIKKFVIIKK